MCVDGGLVCVPFFVWLAGLVGLGGVARKVWTWRKGKATHA